MASLRPPSSPWGCPDDLSDPNTARARPHWRPKGDGESSEGGRYRIWLLLGLVARRRRGDHSSIGEGIESKIKRKVPSGGTHRTTEKGEGPHRTIQGQVDRPRRSDCFQHHGTGVVWSLEFPLSVLTYQANSAVIDQGPKLLVREPGLGAHFWSFFPRSDSESSGL